MEAFKPCLDSHDEEARAHCATEWVIYTRTTSDFYQSCQNALLGNAHVRVTEDNASFAPTPISYYLVNFLTGVAPTAVAVDTATTDEVVINLATDWPEERVEGYDDWIAVPSILCLLWKEQPLAI